PRLGRLRARTRFPDLSLLPRARGATPRGVPALRRGAAARGALARARPAESLPSLRSRHGPAFPLRAPTAVGASVLDRAAVIRLAGAVGGGTQVDRTVQQVDVLPTILDASGVPVPPDLDGLSWLAPQGPATSTEAFATVRLGPFDQQAVVADSWKAIRDFDA